MKIGLKFSVFVFAAAIVVGMGIYGFKSLDEIGDIIGNCGNNGIFKDAENKSIGMIGCKKSDFCINNNCILKLCGCIKFSKTDYLGECCIMKSENRILVASVRYSAPVFYSYSCAPIGRLHTRSECIKAAEKIVAECIPDTASGKGKPYVNGSVTDGFTERITFVFGGKTERRVPVGLRYDTLNAVYFDARQIYFK